MQPTVWSSPQPAAPAGQSGCLHAVLFALACAWVIGVTIVVQSATWFYDQFQILQGVTTPGWFWLGVAFGQALLLAAPVGLLLALVRAPRFRAAYITWVIAIGFATLLSLARLCPITWTQPAAVVQIALSLLATFVLSKWRNRAETLGHDAARPTFSIFNFQCSMLAPALSIGMLVILPWLRDGALGSPLDTLLNGLAALSLGIFAGVLIDRLLVAPLLADSAGALADVGLGGVAAGVALLVLGAGFGFGGQQILLMICLLPLGGAALALARLSYAGAHGQGGAGAIAGLVSMGAAGPLLLLDPDEFFLGIGADEVQLALRSAFFSLLIAFLLGLALWAISARLAETPRRSLALGGLAATWVAGLLVYALVGQPGFYGEKLFVILREQADVGAASQIADRNERLSFVYSTLTQQADRTQANLRATLDQLGVAYQPYYLVNALEVDAGPALRAYLAAQPEVDRILDSPHLRPLPRFAPSLAPPEPASPLSDTPLATGEPQWNIIAIGADRVWDELGVTGKGIVVGESDSGVQGDHPALRDSYRGSDGQNDYNWLDPWNGSRAPVDIGGHGTHTTGTMVGAGGIGVAPGAQWIGCVNLARNLANPPFYLDCLQFMLAPYAQGGDALKDGDPRRAAHVLNNSWGCPPLEGCDADSLGPAVRALRAAGIFVVASAGNEGPRCGSVSDPIAIYDAAFSVGAINQAGDLADFSSRGPVTVDDSERIKPDIVAPGVDVRSALPGNTYGENSGTSMAGPHIAGVVALLWSAQPELIGDIDRTEQILIETARPYEGTFSGCEGTELPNNGTGYGVVDAYAAVRAALGR
jgi:hypothetical protein